jgi:hypothetical protein
MYMLQAAGNFRNKLIPEYLGLMHTGWFYSVFLLHRQQIVLYSPSIAYSNSAGTEPAGGGLFFTSCLFVYLV